MSLSQYGQALPGQDLTGPADDFSPRPFSPSAFLDAPRGDRFSRMSSGVGVMPSFEEWRSGQATAGQRRSQLTSTATRSQIFNYEHPQQLDRDFDGSLTVLYGKNKFIPYTSSDVLELNLYGRAFSAEELSQSEYGRKLLDVSRKNRTSRRGFMEGLTSGSAWDFVPFAGDLVAAGVAIRDMARVRDVMHRIEREGIANVSMDDLALVRLYEAESERMAASTWGAKIGVIVRQAPAFAASFALTGGLTKGVAAAGRAVGLMRPAAESAIAHAASKSVAAALYTARKGGAAFTTKLAEGEVTRIVTDVTAAVAKRYGEKAIVGGAKAAQALALRAVQAAEYTMVKPGAMQAVARFAKEFGARAFVSYGDEFASAAVQGVMPRIREAVGIWAVEAPIRGFFYTAFDQFVANPIIAHAAGADETVTRDQLMFSLSPSQKVRDNARLMAFGSMWVEMASEMSGDGFKALGGILPEIAGKSTRAIQKGPFAAKMAEPTHSFGSKMRQLIESVVGSHEGVAEGVKGVERAIAARTATGVAADMAQREVLALKGKTMLGFWLTKQMVRFNLTPVEALTKLKKVGYNGWIEEFMEERYGDFARGLLGLEAVPAEGLAGRIEAAFQGGLMIDDQGRFQWQDALAELVAFAVPSLYVTASTRLASGLSMTAMSLAENVRNDLQNLSNLPGGVVRQSTEGDVTTSRIVEPKSIMRPDISQEHADMAHRPEKVNLTGTQTTAQNLADLVKTAGRVHKESSVASWRKVVRFAVNVSNAIATGNPMMVFSNPVAATLMEGAGEHGLLLLDAGYDAYYGIRRAETERARQQLVNELLGRETSERGVKTSLTEDQQKEIEKRLREMEPQIEAAVAPKLQNAMVDIVEAYARDFGTLIISDEEIDKFLRDGRFQIETVDGKEMVRLPGADGTSQQMEFSEVKKKYHTELEEAIREEMGILLSGNRAFYGLTARGQTGGSETSDFNQATGRTKGYSFADAVTSMLEERYGVNLIADLGVEGADPRQSFLFNAASMVEFEADQLALITDNAYAQRLVEQILAEQKFPDAQSRRVAANEAKAEVQARRDAAILSLMRKLAPDVPVANNERTERQKAAAVQYARAVAAIQERVMQRTFRTADGKTFRMEQNKATGVYRLVQYDEATDRASGALIELGATTLKDALIEIGAKHEALKADPAGNVYLYTGRTVFSELAVAAPFVAGADAYGVKFDYRGNNYNAESDNPLAIDRGDQGSSRKYDGFAERYAEAQRRVKAAEEFENLPEDERMRLKESKVPEERNRYLNWKHVLGDGSALAEGHTGWEADARVNLKENGKIRTLRPGSDTTTGYLFHHGAFNYQNDVFVPTRNYGNIASLVEDATHVMQHRADIHAITAKRLGEKRRDTNFTTDGTFVRYEANEGTAGGKLVYTPAARAFVRRVAAALAKYIARTDISDKQRAEAKMMRKEWFDADKYDERSGLEGIGHAITAFVYFHGDDAAKDFGDNPFGVRMTASNYAVLGAIADEVRGNVTAEGGGTAEARDARVDFLNFVGLVMTALSRRNVTHENLREMAIEITRDFIPERYLAKASETFAPSALTAAQHKSQFTEALTTEGIAPKAGQVVTEAHIPSDVRKLIENADEDVREDFFVRVAGEWKKAREASVRGGKTRLSPFAFTEFVRDYAAKDFGERTDSGLNVQEEDIPAPTATSINAAPEGGIRPQDAQQGTASFTEELVQSPLTYTSFATSLVKFPYFTPPGFGDWARRLASHTAMSEDEHRDFAEKIWEFWQTWAPDLNPNGQDPFIESYLRAVKNAGLVRGEEEDAAARDGKYTLGSALTQAFDEAERKKRDAQAQSDVSAEGTSDVEESIFNEASTNEQYLADAACSLLRIVSDSVRPLFDAFVPGTRGETSAAIRHFRAGSFSELGDAAATDPGSVYNLFGPDAADHVHPALASEESFKKWIAERLARTLADSQAENPAYKESSRSFAFLYAMLDSMGYEEVLKFVATVRGTVTSRAVVLASARDTDSWTVRHSTEIPPTTNQNDRSAFNLSRDVTRMVLRDGAERHAERVQAALDALQPFVDIGHNTHRDAWGTEENPGHLRRISRILQSGKDTRVTYWLLERELRKMLDGIADSLADVFGDADNDLSMFLRSPVVLTSILDSWVATGFNTSGTSSWAAAILPLGFNSASYEKNTLYRPYFLESLRRTLLAIGVEVSRGSVEDLHTRLGRSLLTLDADGNINPFRKRPYESKRADQSNPYNAQSAYDMLMSAYLESQPPTRAMAGTGVVPLEQPGNSAVVERLYESPEFRGLVEKTYPNAPTEGVAQALMYRNGIYPDGSAMLGRFVSMRSGTGEDLAVPDHEALLDSSLAILGGVLKTQDAPNGDYYRQTVPIFLPSGEAQNPYAIMIPVRMVRAFVAGNPAFRGGSPNSMAVYRALLRLILVDATDSAEMDPKRIPVLFTNHSYSLIAPENVTYIVTSDMNWIGAGVMVGDANVQRSVTASAGLSADATLVKCHLIGRKTGLSFLKGLPRFLDGKDPALSPDMAAAHKVMTAHNTPGHVTVLVDTDPVKEMISPAVKKALMDYLAGTSDVVPEGFEAIEDISFPEREPGQTRSVRAVKITIPTSMVRAANVSSSSEMVGSPTAKPSSRHSTPEGARTWGEHMAAYAGWRKIYDRLFGETEVTESPASAVVNDRVQELFYDGILDPNMAHVMDRYGAGFVTHVLSDIFNRGIPPVYGQHVAMVKNQAFETLDFKAGYPCVAGNIRMGGLERPTFRVNTNHPDLKNRSDAEQREIIQKEYLRIHSIGVSQVYLQSLKSFMEYFQFLDDAKLDTDRVYGFGDLVNLDGSFDSGAWGVDPATGTVCLLGTLIMAPRIPTNSRYRSDSFAARWHGPISSAYGRKVRYTTTAGERVTTDATRWDPGSEGMLELSEPQSAIQGGDADGDTSKLVAFAYSPDGRINRERVTPEELDAFEARATEIQEQIAKLREEDKSNERRSKGSRKATRKYIGLLKQELSRRAREIERRFQNRSADIRLTFRDAPYRVTNTTTKIASPQREAELDALQEKFDITDPRAIAHMNNLVQKDVAARGIITAMIGSLVQANAFVSRYTHLQSQDRLVLPGGLVINLGALNTRMSPERHYQAIDLLDALGNSTYDATKTIGRLRRMGATGVLLNLYVMGLYTLPNMDIRTIDNFSRSFQAFASSRAGRAMLHQERLLDNLGVPLPRAEDSRMGVGGAARFAFQPGMGYLGSAYKAAAEEMRKLLGEKYNEIADFPEVAELSKRNFTIVAAAVNAIASYQGGEKAEDGTVQKKLTAEELAGTFVAFAKLFHVLKAQSDLRRVLEPSMRDFQDPKRLEMMARIAKNVDTSLRGSQDEPGVVQFNGDSATALKHSLDRFWELVRAARHVFNGHPQFNVRYRPNPESDATSAVKHEHVLVATQVGAAMALMPESTVKVYEAILPLQGAKPTTEEVDELSEMEPPRVDLYKFRSLVIDMIEKLSERWATYARTRQGRPAPLRGNEVDVRDMNAFLMAIQTRTGRYGRGISLRRIDNVMSPAIADGFRQLLADHTVVLQYLPWRQSFFSSPTAMLSPIDNELSIPVTNSDVAYLFMVDALAQGPVRVSGGRSLYNFVGQFLQGGARTDTLAQVLHLANASIYSSHSAIGMDEHAAAVRDAVLLALTGEEETFGMTQEELETFERTGDHDFSEPEGYLIDPNSDVEQGSMGDFGFDPKSGDVATPEPPVVSTKKSESTDAAGSRPAAYSPLTRRLAEMMARNHALLGAARGVVYGAVEISESPWALEWVGDTAIPSSTRPGVDIHWNNITDAFGRKVTTPSMTPQTYAPGTAATTITAEEARGALVKNGAVSIVYSPETRDVIDSLRGIGAVMETTTENDKETYTFRYEYSELALAFQEGQALVRKDGYGRSSKVMERLWHKVLNTVRRAATKGDQRKAGANHVSVRADDAARYLKSGFRALLVSNLEESGEEWNTGALDGILIAHAALIEAVGEVSPDLMISVYRSIEYWLSDRRTAAREYPALERLGPTIRGFYNSSDIYNPARIAQIPIPEQGSRNVKNVWATALYIYTSLVGQEGAPVSALQNAAETAAATLYNSLPGTTRTRVKADLARAKNEAKVITTAEAVEGHASLEEGPSESDDAQKREGALSPTPTFTIRPYFRASAIEKPTPAPVVAPTSTPAPVVVPTPAPAPAPTPTPTSAATLPPPPTSKAAAGRSVVKLPVGIEGVNVEKFRDRGGVSFIIKENIRRAGFTVSFTEISDSVEEGITKSEAKGKHLGLTFKGDAKAAGRKLAASLKGAKSNSLHIAGNDLFDLRLRDVSQEQANDYVFLVLKEAISHSWISSIYVSGDLGAGMAGAIAGTALGIPVTILFTRHMQQRLANGPFVNVIREDVQQQIKEGVDRLAEKFEGVVKPKEATPPTTGAAAQDIQQLRDDLADVRRDVDKLLTGQEELRQGQTETNTKLGDLTSTLSRFEKAQAEAEARQKKVDSVNKAIRQAKLPVEVRQRAYVVHLADGALPPSGAAVTYSADGKVEAWSLDGHVFINAAAVLVKDAAEVVTREVAKLPPLVGQQQEPTPVEPTPVVPRPEKPRAAKKPRDAQKPAPLLPHAGDPIGVSPEVHAYLQDFAGKRISDISRSDRDYLRANANITVVVATRTVPGRDPGRQGAVRGIAGFVRNLFDIEHPYGDGFLDPGKRAFGISVRGAASEGMGQRGYVASTSAQLAELSSHLQTGFVELYKAARENPDRVFLLTPVGTTRGENLDLSVQAVADLLPENMPRNIIPIKAWEKYAPQAAVEPGGDLEVVADPATPAPAPTGGDLFSGARAPSWGDGSASLAEINIRTPRRTMDDALATEQDDTPDYVGIASRNLALQDDRLERRRQLDDDLRAIAKQDGLVTLPPVADTATMERLAQVQVPDATVVEHAARHGTAHRVAVEAVGNPESARLGIGEARRSSVSSLLEAEALAPRSSVLRAAIRRLHLVATDMGARTDAVDVSTMPSRQYDTKYRLRLEDAFETMTRAALDLQNSRGYEEADKKRAMDAYTAAADATRQLRDVWSLSRDVDLRTEVQNAQLDAPTFIKEMDKKEAEELAKRNAEYMMIGQQEALAEADRLYHSEKGEEGLLPSMSFASLVDSDSYYQSVLLRSYSGHDIRSDLFNRETLLSTVGAIQAADYLIRFFGAGPTGAIPKMVPIEGLGAEGRSFVNDGAIHKETNKQKTRTGLFRYERPTGPADLAKQFGKAHVLTEGEHADAIFALQAAQGLMGDGKALPTDITLDLSQFTSGIASVFGATDKYIYESTGFATWEEFMENLLDVDKMRDRLNGVDENSRPYALDLAIAGRLAKVVPQSNLGATLFDNFLGELKRVLRETREEALLAQDAKNPPATDEKYWMNKILLRLEEANVIYLRKIADPSVVAEAGNEPIVAFGAKIALPLDIISEQWEKSKAFAKLKENGRDPEMLKLSGVTKYLRPRIDRVMSAARSQSWMATGSGTMFGNGLAAGLPFFRGGGFFQFFLAQVLPQAPKDYHARVAEITQSYLKVWYPAMRADRHLSSDQQESHALFGESAAAASLSPANQRQFKFLRDLFREVAMATGVDASAADIWTAIAESEHLQRVTGLNPNSSMWDVATVVYEAAQSELFASMWRSGTKPDRSFLEGHQDLTGFCQAVEEASRRHGLELDIRPGASWREIYNVTGALPMNTTAPEYLSKLANDLGNMQRWRMLMNQAILLTDERGNPTYVMDPGLGTQDDTITDQVWEMAARRWVNVFGRGTAKDIYYDAGQTGKQNAHRLYEILHEASRNSEDYVEVEMPPGMTAASWILARKDAANDDLRGSFSLADGWHSNYIKQIMALPGFIPDSARPGWFSNMVSWSKSISVMNSLFFPIATAMESPAAAIGPVATFLGYSKFGSNLGRKLASGSGILADAMRYMDVDPDAPTMVEIMQSIASNDPAYTQLMELAMAAGLESQNRSRNVFDQDRSQITKQITKATDAARRAFGDSAAKKLRVVLEGTLQNPQELAFEYVIQATKLAVFAALNNKMRRQAVAAGRAWDPVRAMRPWAHYINAEVGGIDPATYSWLTPRNMSFLHRLMFSWNWTLGAWDAGGGNIVTSRLMGISTSAQSRKYMFLRWFRMYMTAMQGIPTLLQATGVALAKAMGVGDDDDKWFPWQNERSKTHGYWDMTPWLKVMGRTPATAAPLALGSALGFATGGIWGALAAGLGTAGAGYAAGLRKKSMADLKLALPETLGMGLLKVPFGGLIPAYTGREGGIVTTRRRRYYGRFAKQGWEVFRWVENPAASFASKMSIPTQKILEGLFGYSLATGWKMDFASENFWERWVTTNTRESAWANLGTAFLPFSLQGNLRDPETGALAAVTSISKGMSGGKAIAEMSALFSRMGDANEYAKMIRGNPGAWTDFHVVAVDWLNDLRRNGYDPEAALSNAVGMAGRPLFEQLHRALPQDPQDPGRPKQAAMAARGLYRLNITNARLKTALRNRDKNQNIVRRGAHLRLTNEIMREAFLNPYGVKDYGPKATQMADRGGDVRGFLASDNVPTTILDYTVVKPAQLSDEDRAFFDDNPEVGGFFDNGDRYKPHKEQVRRDLGPRGVQSADLGGDVSGFLVGDEVPKSVLGYPIVPTEQLTEGDRAFFDENPDIGGFFDKNPAKEV